jgi:hypothetical protein
MLLFRVLQLCHSDSSLLSFRLIASVIPTHRFCHSESSLLSFRIIASVIQNHRFCHSESSLLSFRVKRGILYLFSGQALGENLNAFN